MKKNDEFILPVTDLTDLGSGFGRAPDGSAVFVPGTVPGDRVLCHLIKVNKQYAVGKLLRVETPSPYRTAPECPVFGSCGGCSLCHITPDYEREMKKRFVEAATEIGAGFSFALIVTCLGLCVTLVILLVY